MYIFVIEKKQYHEKYQNMKQFFFSKLARVYEEQQQ